MIFVPLPFPGDLWWNLDISFGRTSRSEAKKIPMIFMPGMASSNSHATEDCEDRDLDVWKNEFMDEFQNVAEGRSIVTSDSIGIF